MVIVSYTKTRTRMFVTREKKELHKLSKLIKKDYRSETIEVCTEKLLKYLLELWKYNRDKVYVHDIDSGKSFDMPITDLFSNI